MQEGGGIINYENFGAQGFLGIWGAWLFSGSWGALAII